MRIQSVKYDRLFRAGKIYSACILIISLCGPFLTGLSAQDAVQIELQSVQFHGNFTIPTSELQSAVASKESPGWFSEFLNSFTPFGEGPTYFDSLIIPTDMEALRAYYFDNGYFESRFFSRYYFNDDSTEATIVFHIEEKDPSYFRNFDVTGVEWIAPEFQERINNDIVSLDTTQRYSKALVKEKILNIMSFLRDHGYMLARSEIPTVKIDTLLNRVDLIVNIDVGNRYKVSDVFVSRTGEGRELVDDELIRDIVDIEPGSWYSFYDTQRAQVRLYRTNLFTSAIVGGVVSDTMNNRVPIGISVDVGLLHELSPEIIMNNEDNTFNLGLGLNFIKKNLFGDARKLTFGISAVAQNIGKFIKEFSFEDSTVFGYADARLSLEQPYIFGRPINTKIETYLTLQKLRSEYNSRILGTRLNFDFELPRNTYLNSISTYINWEDSRFVFTDNYLRLFISDSVLALIKENIPDFNVSQVQNTVIGLDLGANRTDNLLFPTKGYNLSLLLEHGNGLSYLFSKISGSDFSRPMYYKAVATIRGFLPLGYTGVDVLGAKFKAGIIRAYRGNKDDIPVNQRFYAGGSNSIRGWGTRDLVPQDELLFPENPTGPELEQFFRQGILPGGFIILEGTFEMRNRLLSEFGSALFVDYGNTWNDIMKIRWDEFAVAAGFGFRYYSEFVPIRVDFGFKIYDPWDRRSIFNKILFSETLEIHLGIGEAF